MADEKYMTFITGVHYSKNMLQTLNGITFLFDPNWEAGTSETPTLPVSFFHIKALHEIMDSEISTKTLLFYNDNSSPTKTVVSGGMTDVVADNIIIKPKTYKLDVIVPFSDISLLTGHHVLQPEQMANVASLLMTGSAKNLSVAPYLTCVTPYVDIIKSLMKQITSIDWTDASSIITGVMSTPDYNKNSLEAMWRNRSILKLKLWNGWRYKYVSIVSMDISKEPTEDGVYQATLTLQEMPIMTFRDKGTLKLAWKNPILAAQGNVIKGLLNAKEEV